jgi:hypothetical protein
MGACKSPRDDGKVGVPWFRAKDSTLASFELAGYLLNVTASLVRTSGQSCRCFVFIPSLSWQIVVCEMRKLHPQELFSAGQAEQQPVEQRIAALLLSGLP